jgi:hypothetical protein
MVLLLENARKLVKYVKQASLQHYFTPSLKPHVETRWYSNTDMLESIFLNFQFIQSDYNYIFHPIFTCFVTRIIRAYLKKGLY